MRKIINAITIGLILFAFTFLLPGCFKDTIKHTYTLYYPVYKSLSEVRANINSSSATPVKTAGKLFVYGNYIFLNEVNKGVHIIDNTNPSAPVNKYFINIPGNLDMAVKGNTLYADLFADLVTIDISNPANVTVKKITEKVFPGRLYANGFSADGNLVIVDWIQKDTSVYEDASLTHWVGLRDYMLFSGSVDKAVASASPTVGISGSMARFTLLGNYLYTVSDAALNVFNVSNEQQPVFTNKVNIGWGIETIYPFKNNLFIGSRSGMFAYSVSNPAQPAQLSVFSHATVCDPVIADDNYAFVTLSTGSRCAGFNNQLDIVNVQNITKPTLVKSYPLANPHGLSKDGKLLFICDGNAGLKVFDASDVNALQLLQNIPLPDAYDVIATNNIAMVVGKDGLYQYDYSNSSKLKYLSTISYK